MEKNKYRILEDVPGCCVECRYTDCDLFDEDGDMLYYCQLGLMLPTKKNTCESRIVNVKPKAQKMPKRKNRDKYTNSARGQECQIGIPEVCNGNSDTVVFAHIGGAGWALKHPNIIGSYACSDCHDHVDGRATNNDYTHDELQYMFLQGMVLTQLIMIREGTLVL